MVIELREQDRTHTKDLGLHQQSHRQEGRVLSSNVIQFKFLKDHISCFAENRLERESNPSRQEITGWN